MYVENFNNPKDHEDREEEFTEEQGRGERASNKHLKDALLSWRAPEYEIYEKGRQWYLYASLVLAAIVAYAVWTNSPVMAITFILIGVVGYIVIQKETEVLDFAITPEGVVAGRSIYEYDNIESFWIFYEPGESQVVSLHVKNKIMPFAHIPLHDQNPELVREILLEYLPEVKQEPSLVDTFERMLGI